MPIFNPNIPLSTDILSDSQKDLNDNNMSNNTWSSVDHYALDDLTANNGFHKAVHTPSQASSPSTHPATSINPIFYGASDNVNLPLLQYSRGPSNAVQGPVTTLQSSAAGISLLTTQTTAVLNFNGMAPAVPFCYGILTWGYNTTNPNPSLAGGALISWNGSQGNATNFGSTAVAAQFSGSTLQLLCNIGGGVTGLSWTLQFSRIFTPL